MTQLDGCQVKLASVSAFANHCRQKSGWSGLVVGVFLCDGRTKETSRERKKGTNWC